MAKQRVDKFPNRAFIRVTESGANTLTFGQIQFGVGIFQGVAAVIHRVEFMPLIGTLADIVAGDDQLSLALTNRDDLVSLIPNNQSVLMSKRLNAAMIGAVVSLQWMEFPLVIDFTSLPGGGIIIPANPLYLGVEGASLAAAAVVDCTIYLTFRDLTDSEYVELVQTIMPANI